MRRPKSRSPSKRPKQSLARSIEQRHDAQPEDDGEEEEAPEDEEEEEEQPRRRPIAARGKKSNGASRHSRDDEDKPASAPPRLYRVKRLVEVFDVRRETIWRWQKNGTLPPFTKICGVRGLTEQQVREALARGGRS